VLWTANTERYADVKEGLNETAGDVNGSWCHTYLD
jgi:hypothetical protein